MPVRGSQHYGRLRLGPNPPGSLIDLPCLIGPHPVPNAVLDGLGVCEPHFRSWYDRAIPQSQYIYWLRALGIGPLQNNCSFLDILAVKVSSVGYCIPATLSKVTLTTIITSLR